MVLRSDTLPPCSPLHTAPDTSLDLLADAMRANAKTGGRESGFPREHLPDIDFCALVIRVIPKNQVAGLVVECAQALVETCHFRLERVAGETLGHHPRDIRLHVLAMHAIRDTIKIESRVTAIRFEQSVELSNDPVDRLVGEIFAVRCTSIGENSDQSATDLFVPLACGSPIGREPSEKALEFLAGDRPPLYERKGVHYFQFPCSTNPAQKYGNVHRGFLRISS